MGTASVRSPAVYSNEEIWRCQKYLIIFCLYYVPSVEKPWHQRFRIKLGELAKRFPYDYTRALSFICLRRNCLSSVVSDRCYCIHINLVPVVDGGAAARFSLSPCNFSVTQRLPLLNNCPPLFSIDIFFGARQSYNWRLSTASLCVSLNIFINVRLRENEIIL